MKFVKIIATTIVLILIQYLSQNLFLLKYINWILVVSMSIFWFGDYKKAVIIGLSAGIIFDGLIQSPLGITAFSMMLPLLLMLLIDNLIRINSNLSKLVIAEISLALGLIILRLSNFGEVSVTDFTFRLKETLIKILVSGLFLLLFSLLFQTKSKDNYGFRIRGI